jgi:hypothetical protein
MHRVSTCVKILNGRREPDIMFLKATYKLGISRGFPIRKRIALIYKQITLFNHCNLFITINVIKQTTLSFYNVTKPLLFTFKTFTYEKNSSYYRAVPFFRDGIM